MEEYNAYNKSPSPDSPPMIHIDHVDNPTPVIPQEASPGPLYNTDSLFVRTYYHHRGPRSDTSSEYAQSNPPSPAPSSNYSPSPDSSFFADSFEHISLDHGSPLISPASPGATAPPFPDHSAAFHTTGLLSPFGYPSLYQTHHARSSSSLPEYINGQPQHDHDHDTLFQIPSLRRSHSSGSMHSASSGHEIHTPAENESFPASNPNVLAFPFPNFNGTTTPDGEPPFHGVIQLPSSFSSIPGWFDYAQGQVGPPSPYFTPSPTHDFTKGHPDPSNAFHTHPHPHPAHPIMGANVPIPFMRPAAAVRPMDTEALRCIIEETDDSGAAAAYISRNGKPMVSTPAGHEASTKRRKNPGRFKCIHSGCGKDFTRKLGLQNHLKSHLGIRDKMCKFCRRLFATSLGRHMNRCKANPNRQSHPPASSSRGGGGGSQQQQGQGSGSGSGSGHQASSSAGASSSSSSSSMSAASSAPSSSTASTSTVKPFRPRKTE